MQGAKAQHLKFFIRQLASIWQLDGHGPPPPQGFACILLQTFIEQVSCRGNDDSVMPVIPNKANRVHPWPFVAEIYRERNCVERLVNKLKQFRRIATRYEKLGETFMALVHLVSAFILTR